MSVSLRELTDLCVGETGRTVPIAPVTETESVDLRIYITNNRKVREDFGWSPTRDPARIVRDIRAWIDDHSEILKDLFV